MGDGCTTAGAWKGFREFYVLGYVDDIADTLADSIAVGRPRNTIKACRALEESGGTAVTVPDDEILAAEELLGSTEGVYAEPAGAAPVAGVQRALSEGIVVPWVVTSIAMLTLYSIIALGIIASMLFAFTLSFDNVTQTFFWVGGGIETLPIVIFGKIRTSTEPRPSTPSVRSSSRSRSASPPPWRSSPPGSSATPLPRPRRSSRTTRCPVG